MLLDSRRATQKYSYCAKHSQSQLRDALDSLMTYGGTLFWQNSDCRTILSLIMRHGVSFECLHHYLFLQSRGQQLVRGLHGNTQSTHADSDRNSFQWKPWSYGPNGDSYRQWHSHKLSTPCPIHRWCSTVDWSRRHPDRINFIDNGCCGCYPALRDWQPNHFAECNQIASPWDLDWRNFISRGNLLIRGCRTHFFIVYQDI